MLILTLMLMHKLMALLTLTVSLTLSFSYLGGHLSDPNRQNPSQLYIFSQKVRTKPNWEPKWSSYIGLIRVRFVV